MNRLNTIKHRLAQYTDANTDTDEKLENGAIADWVMNSDEDEAWLLARVDELCEALTESLRWIGRLSDWEGAGDPDIDTWRAVLAKAKGEQS